MARGGIEFIAEDGVGDAVEVASFVIDVASGDAIESGDAVLGKGNKVANREIFDGVKIA